MAITQNLYTGDGSTVLYSLTFPYLEVTDIKVSLDGADTTAYTLANATQIQFNTAPANGAAIRLYRQTDDETLAATFFPGSAIRAQDLNDNFTQNLYVVQEVNNNALTTDGSNPMVGDFNLGGFKITNLAAPVASTDAATKKYVDDISISGLPNVIPSANVVVTQQGTGAVQRTVESKLTEIISVKDFGAVGDGSTDDTVAINKAITACRAAGGGTVVFPTASYVIKRRVVGSQEGSIYLPPKVNLDFNNSTLLLQDNCAFIYGSGITNGKVMTITGNVTANSLTFTVDSTATVAAGDRFFVRLINNPFDAVETKWSYWVRIVSVDSSTQVTVDVPAPEAMTVGSTGVNNRRLTGYSERLENTYIRNVRMIQSTGGNSEGGIDLSLPINFLVENVYSENPGPGAVMVRYGDSCTFRNIYVSESIAQGGQGSKGRVLNFWNCHNCVFEGVKGECFQGSAVFAESYCRNCAIRDSEWHNTWFYRNGTSKVSDTIFFVAQGSEVSFENTTVYGRGTGTIIFDSGGSGGSNPFSNLFLRTAEKIKGGLFLNAWVGGRFVDQVSNVDVVYNNVKTFSRRGTYTNSMSDTTYTAGFVPPRGIVLNGWYHLTDNTGLGDQYITRGAATIILSGSALTVGARTRLPGSFYGYGTDYPWNIPNVAGSYKLYTTTVNANTEMTWEYLYIPVGDEDSTLGRTQGIDA